MSEQIVREASAWQGTIESDYRESAKIFETGSLKVLIRRRLNLHPSSFWQGCPKPDQYPTKHLPNRLTSDSSEIALRLLGRFFEHYCFAVGQRFNRVLAGKQFICCQIKPNKIKKQFTHSSHLRASPMATQGVSQTAGRKGTSLTAAWTKATPQVEHKNVPNDYPEKERP